MVAKTLSLILAVCALIGVVLYAQNNAEKEKQITPVFESSKSPMPKRPKDVGITPIEDSTAPQKPAKPKTEKLENNADNEVSNPDTTQAQQQEKPKPKKKKKVMPTSKSYIPD